MGHSLTLALSVFISLLFDLHSEESKMVCWSNSMDPAQPSEKGQVVFTLQSAMLVLLLVTNPWSSTDAPLNPGVEYRHWFPTSSMLMTTTLNSQGTKSEETAREYRIANREILTKGYKLII